MAKRRSLEVNGCRLTEMPDMAYIDDEKDPHVVFVSEFGDLVITLDVTDIKPMFCSITVESSLGCSAGGCGDTPPAAHKDMLENLKKFVTWVEEPG